MQRNIQHNLSQRVRRSRRVHGRVKAIPGRPKLLVIRSNRYLYLQVIDEQGRVLAAESDVRLLKNGQLKKGLTKTQRAEAIGEQMAVDLKKAKIKAVAVDRGAYKFHGRIKAAVEVIRDKGIEA